MSGKLPKVTIYTDGGCRPNPGPGGWGAVLLLADGTTRELSGSEDETTNNRMEIRAAIEALDALESPHEVDLFTDSTYLRSGITKWLPKWEADGWRTSTKAAVKNRDLWEELAAAFAEHRVSWHWTKGHAGDRWNERADELASAAMPRPPLPVDDPKAVHLFAAVAYSGKKQAGSWAVLLLFGETEKHLSGREAGTSANRMHLRAAVSGLEELRRPVRVHLYTASDYLKDGATSWVAGWKSRGWKTREGKPVSHRDLWQRLDALTGRHRVEWHVVEGKTPPEEMEHAKHLAREALADEQSS